MLVVVDGPEAGTKAIVDFERDSPLIVGSSAVCHVRLSDRMVSRRHVSFDVCEQGLRMVDLDSTNGTLIRGIRLREGIIAGGDVVVIGNTSLRIDALPDSEVASSLSTAHRFGRVIGSSVAMRRVYRTAERFAQVELPVLIEGETGTGKELLSEAIHDASPRANGPFIVFDCTAVPPNLLEAALFGHVKGAFTGAETDRIGIFEEASGGTLLIDEIGELDIALQPKLLRAIERSAVQPVGSNEWRKVDVRILSATRRDLDREVTAGRFRDDLLYRLAVGRIALPPLRDRKGDITLLAHHFWRNLGAEAKVLPAAVIARWEDYAWPGNVRELNNTIARYLALGAIEDAVMPPSAVEDAMERILAMDLSFPRARQAAADEFERRYVQRVLGKYNGNVMRAANASGIARRYFQILRARSTLEK